MPVSVSGAKEHATPAVLVTDDVGVHTIAAALLDVRILPLPLATLPSVMVTTVLGMPATVTVAAVMVTFVGRGLTVLGKVSFGVHRPPGSPCCPALLSVT